MTRWLLVLLLSLTFGMAPWEAQSAAAKFAYVDMQKAMSKSNAAKHANSVLRKKLASKRKEEQSMERQIKSLKKQLEKLKKSGSISNPDKIATVQEKFRRKFRQYQRMVEDNRVVLEREDNRWTKKIFNNVREVTRVIGKERNYTAIFSKGQVLYHSPAIDITDEVIKRVNARTKGRLR
ncbi:MAG: OmpH family outer membrane protein [Magnetococcales bacterium]|nr:OmpH family outer membrane protein [Magnetococcales bacterium]